MELCTWFLPHLVHKEEEDTDGDGDCVGISIIKVSLKSIFLDFDGIIPSSALKHSTKSTLTRKQMYTGKNASVMLLRLP